MKEKQWNKMSDEDRWKWVINNQDKGITVFLDNDDTFLCFDNDDSYSLTFDGYLGWSDGVISLLTAINVKAEMV